MTGKIDQQTIATSELCELLGLTQGRLSQLVAAGILARERRGRFRLLASVSNYLEFLRSRAPGSGAPETIEDYRRGRARLVSLQADIAQHQLDRERGEFVRIEDVGASVHECFSAVRAKFLAGPTKYAARIMPEDPKRAFKALTIAVHEVLTEISEKAEAELVEAAKQEATK